MNRVLIATGCLLLSATACAVDQVQLSWGQLEADRWRLREAAVTLDWSQAGEPLLRVQAAALQIGEQQIEQLSLVCEGFEILPQAVDCRRGQLSFRSDWLNADAVPAAVRYHFATRELTVSVSRLVVAGGQLGLRFQRRGDRWLLDATLTDTTLAGVAGVLARTGIAVPGFEFQGHIGGTLSAEGNAAGLARCRWRLTTRAAGYSNRQGSQAAEALVLVSSGSATPQGDQWRIQAELSAQQGGLYAEPVYVEFSADQPLAVSVDMRWRQTGGELSVDSLLFDQPGVVSARLNARLVPAAPDPVRNLQLNIDEARLPRFYTTWLQPWLTATALGGLETEGGLRGRARIQDGRAQALQLQLDKVSLRDRNGQFAVSRLDGNLRWSSDALEQSTLEWHSASLYQLQFGAAGLAL
jgi:hypothetical protein